MNIFIYTILITFFLSYNTNAVIYSNFYINKINILKEKNFPVILKKINTFYKNYYQQYYLNSYIFANKSNLEERLMIETILLLTI